MKQIKLSINMLFKDWKNNQYYLLMIAIVTAITFIFTNINYNQNLRVIMEVSQFGSLVPRYSSFVTFVIVIFAIVLAIYAYTYLLSKKILELKILKIAGGSLRKIGLFLFVQNIIIIFLGSFIGILLGFVLNPIINYFIYNFLNIKDTCFYLHNDTITDCIKMNLLILAITAILGIGYVYRYEIKNLSDEKSDWTKDKRIIKFPTSVHMFLYLAGIIMFLTSDEVIGGVLAYSLIGCCGASGLTRIKLCKYIKKANRNKYYTDKIKKISNSNLIYSLKNSNLLVLGLLFSSTVMLSWAVGSINTSKEFIVAFVAYIISMILLSSSVLCKYLFDLKKRNVEYFLLYKCGYTIDEIKKIISDEIKKFYFVIFCFSVIYIILILFYPLILNKMNFITVLSIFSFYVIIIFIMMMLTIYLSIKSMKKEIQIN